MVSLSSGTLAFVAVSLVFCVVSASTPLKPCTRGRSTAYTVETVGACGFGSYRDIYTFAPNTAFFNGSNSCGACFEVTGPLGTHVFMAADECPSSGNEQWCSGDMNHFDLDERAFPTLATSDWGVTFTQVRPIVCPTTSPVSVVIGWGAEPYNSGYLQVHIWNHKVPIDAVAVVDAASTSYTSLTRTNYNAWEWAPGRNIVYPVMYRVTSVYGESITVNISSSPSSVGQKFDGTQQFTQWPTSVASNVCPTMFEYDIFVNGLNNGAPNHQVAESWLTGSGPNLAYSASLPSNATLAAQNNFDAYAEWGFYTPGASVPAAEIAGIELQVYAASSLSGIQLVWGEYNLGHIVNLPTVTSTWSYVYLDKGSFGAALPDIQKLAFKNSLGTAASGFTIANFRLVPTGVVVEPAPVASSPTPASTPSMTPSGSPSSGVTGPSSFAPIALPSFGVIILALIFSLLH